MRHFLLIGFLGMFIGAIVFFYMGISRKVNTVMHVLTFFIAAVSACAYYAEWAGLGVEYKTTDTTPRVIFWAHYLDWVVTGPVRCLARRVLTCPVQQGQGERGGSRVRLCGGERRGCGGGAGRAQGRVEVEACGDGGGSCMEEGELARSRALGEEE